MTDSLSKADVQNIIATARKVPRISKHVRRAVRGTELLELGYTTYSNEQVVGDRTYEVDTILEANVTSILLRICREQGMQALAWAAQELQHAVITSRGSLQFVRH